MKSPGYGVLFGNASSFWRWELGFWAAWPVLLFLPQSNLVLLSQMLIWGLFALSLDLVLGYRGIASLGHALFFGIGAYTAGLLSKHGWTEPVSGLCIAALLSGLTGAIVGRILLGMSGATCLTATLCLNMLAYEAVTKATAVTGGDNGLDGLVVSPLLGIFRFDFAGRIAFVYSFIVVLVCVLAARLLVRSAFGLSLLGARDNTPRIVMLGAPIERDATVVFCVSAFLAGVAGALMTQTTQFVSPEVMSVTRSADVLMMLIIGGVATLYGGFFGAIVFMSLQQVLSAWSPTFWYFWIGVILVITVAAFRKGVLPSLADAMRRDRSAGR